MSSYFCVQALQKLTDNRSVVNKPVEWCSQGFGYAFGTNYFTYNVSYSSQQENWGAGDMRDPSLIQWCVLIMKNIEKFKGLFKSDWSLSSFLKIKQLFTLWVMIEIKLIMTLFFWPYFLPLRTNTKKQTMGHFIALFFSIVKRWKTPPEVLFRRLNTSNPSTNTFPTSELEETHLTSKAEFKLYPLKVSHFLCNYFSHILTKWVQL